MAGIENSPHNGEPSSSDSVDNEKKTVVQPSLPQQNPPAYTVTERQWTAYGAALSPMVIVILAFIFYGILHVQKDLHAPQTLVNFRRYSVRSYAQAFTLLGTVLSSAVKWGLQRAFKLVVRKRFLHERRVDEIETWTALAGCTSVFWDWRQSIRRWKATIITGTVWVLAISLASGFVALLTPLPMEVGVPIAGETELDFGVSSPDCLAWYNEQMDIWLQESCDIWMPVSGTGERRCIGSAKLLDVMEAGRISMLGYVESVRIDDDIKDYVFSLSRLASLRLLGSTGGTAPISYISNGTRTYFAKSIGETTDYELTRQGVWSEVSCQYADPSTFPITFHNTSDGLAVEITCPDPSQSYTRLTNNGRAKLLTMDQCFNHTTRVWDIYARSFFTPAQVWNTTVDPNDKSAYGGVGSMKCTVTPTVRDVHVGFNPEIDAFSVPPENISHPTGFQPLDLLENIGWSTWGVVDDAQGIRIGHLMAVMIDTVATSELGLPSGMKDERYTGLVSSMLKGMYEFEASHFRFSRTLNTTAAPSNCVRPVNGQVFPHSLGWQPQTSTLIGLMPLAVITVILLACTFGTMFHEQPLYRFSPIHPISLIAATSAGNLSFAPDEAGDPESETVRTTKVVYGPGPDAPSKWGLRTEDSKQGGEA